MDFNELPIDNKLKNSIKFADFKTPTPIQSKSIPISLMGKDILGTAQTGTGKTLAFTIPMINKLILDKNAMALIICPTRELASQVMQTVLKLNVREMVAEIMRIFFLFKTKTHLFKNTMVIDHYIIIHKFTIFNCPKVRKLHFNCLSSWFYS